MDAKSYILLVNRDFRFLKTVSQSLIDAGYPTLTTTTIGAAMNMLSSNTVALILCDSDLTDSSGYDFLGSLKSDHSLQKIPFVFLVSSRFIVDSLEDEVSKILKAFDMGAADFIVDTLDEEISKLLIKRINKILPANFREKPLPAPPKEAHPESSTGQAAAVLPAPKEQREDKRIIPIQVVGIQISRDNVLWMPGQITNINEQGLMMETSLLGNLGMLLYVRVPLPGYKYAVVSSHIKHIKIIEHSFSAEIGVEIDDSVEWIQIYNYIAKLMGIVSKSGAKEVPADDKVSVEKVEDARTSVRADDQKKQYVYVDPLLYNADESDGDKALEIKFYRSLIGKQLGNYKAVSFIGAGSMAGVFKGWDVFLERNVALKIISYKLSTIAAYRDMFFKEARLVSRLIHPNIAQIYHIDQRDDLLYFVMELVNGGTLADIIKDKNNLKIAKCLEHFITTCRTLDFVNKQNIVHRDIKPANIMIDDRGILKIVDFGVAIIDDETNKKRKSQVFGSPLYASPECIMGKPLDCCSDIYSLGATFYNVFAGEPPFTGDSVEAIVHKHLNEQLVPLMKMNPMVSNDLSEVIEKMMAKKPKERYQNYRALLNDLTEVVL